ncbi:MAG TPA: VWA domain-containing protein [Gemmatimonadaceae bacterium]|nr:VWA domain-containing protein [Gemmatimonadaceae bacterium]
MPRRSGSFLPSLLNLLNLVNLAGLVSLVGVATPAVAQVVELPVRPCPPPCPPNAECLAAVRCRPMVAQVQRTASRVRADLDGRVVRYEVTETYVNRGGVVGEADYLLPLPKGAAFEDLALSINDEMVTGETMGADRARAVYEEIVRRLRDPALVEWMGHGLLRTRIFPIQPGEEKRVVVRFRAVAEREGDALRLDWLGTRRGNDTGGNESFVLTYENGGAFGDAYSPTHSLQRSNDRGRHVVRAEGARGPLTVLVPVRHGNGAAIALLAHAASGEDGYALITLSPPARAARETPRDVVFVLDVSGSMSGRKMEQARAAGRALLQTLTSADRFRVIDFSSDVRAFRDGWAAATSANVREALAYLDALRANGGTNIQAALEEALRGDAPDGRLPLVLFLTDGAPTVGETRAEAIAQRAADLRRQRRVFTFGIGADVNAALLEQLALQGRGTATFVRLEESVERAVGIVTERLTRPVVTDVQIRVDGVRLYGMQPQGSIDLFAGQDLVVLARYAGARESALLTVGGRGADGPVQWTARVSLPARAGENAFVARLWAVQRVGYLSAERRRTGGNPELDAELRQLGERYGIPTELTSYLVTEPGMRLSAGAAGAAGAVGAGGRDAAQLRPLSSNAAAPAMDRFEAAKAAAEQRSARTLADLDERLRKDESSRIAGTHTFRLRDSVWTDTRPLDGARVVRIRAFSPAYFEVVRRLPELGPLFAVGERVRTHGRRVAIEIAEDGASQLDAAALDALVRDW